MKLVMDQNRLRSKPHETFAPLEAQQKIFPSADDANSKYIITTATPPPKSMRQGSRWLLDPVLDSRKKDKRLLQEDF